MTTDWLPIATYHERYPDGNVDVLLVFPGGHVTHGYYVKMKSEEFAYLTGWRTGCEGLTGRAQPWMWMPWPEPPV